MMAIQQDQPQVNPIQAVGDKTFILQNGVWTDTTFTPDTIQTQKVTFLSDEYFALLDSKPELAQYLRHRRPRDRRPRRHGIRGCCPKHNVRSTAAAPLHVRGEQTVLRPY